LLNNNISEEKIYEALKLVGLTRINDINKKLNINDYSTGELSLFNIARAIVLDSKILFLDEMNAKIDCANAQNIIKVIDKISKDKIVLSINHYGELLNNSEIINLEKTIR
jgi:ABC transporter, ATP-binding protein